MAEKLMLDDISTGASGDIQQATSIAKAMVMKYGMSERLGPISFDDSSHSVFIGRDFSQTKSYSEETASIIDEEIRAIFDKAMTKCEEILTEHRDILIATAEYLLKNETMDGKLFAYICSHDGQLPPPEEEEQKLAGDAPDAGAAERPIEGQKPAPELDRAVPETEVTPETAEPDGGAEAPKSGEDNAE